MINKISAVVVTYNRINKLREAMEHLLNQTYELYRIVVVNNNSSDGTREYLEDLKNRTNNLRVINLNRNLGGAGGFNIGTKLAYEEGSEWIALSDDDAMYDSDYFKYISRAIKSNSNILAFSGNVFDSSGEFQYGHRRIITNWISLKSRPLRDDELSKDTDIDIFSFVGAVVNRKVIQQLGLPNKNYFISEDDTEYSLRIKSISRIINVSKACIVHKSFVGQDNKAMMKRERWILYYGIRNGLLNEINYSKHKILLNFYIAYEMILKYLRLFMGRHFKGRRVYFFHLYNDAFMDSFKGSIGINEKYMPN